jgi:hypothetical protein
MCTTRVMIASPIDDFMLDHKALLSPDRLWSRVEVLTRPCPVPPVSGVYAWWFRGLSEQVVAANCIRHEGYALLYVGISPKAPPANGAAPSRQNLRTRLRYHYQGNAEGSTLRLTLGCLLSAELGIELQRVGRGKRRTFLAGERMLSAWMAENAFTSWMSCDNPWMMEEELIRSLSLPLNLHGNQRHPFHFALTAIRRKAKLRACTLPMCPQ